jgi:DNA-directed RNA polymerase subunit beta'
MGLKENVIVGRLIPAGTGLAYHLDRKRRAEQGEMHESEETSVMDTSDVEEALKQALSE